MQTPVAQSMRQKLTAALTPSLLEITDNSAKHAGHAGHRPGGETHFALYIVSDCFDGLNHVQRHRLVYETLAQDMASQIHALELKLKTLGEHNQ